MKEQSDSEQLEKELIDSKGRHSRVAAKEAIVSKLLFPDSYTVLVLWNNVSLWAQASLELLAVLLPQSPKS